MGFLIKLNYLFLFYSFLVVGALAQKPLIDSNAIHKWPAVDAPVISNNGVFVSFSVINRKTASVVLYLQNMDNGWKAAYNNAWNCRFSPDNKIASFETQDTLYLIDLNKQVPITAIPVRAVKRPLLDGGEWLAYEPIDRVGKLVVLNVSSGKKISFDSVNHYLWQDHGKALVIENLSGNRSVLQWLDLSNLSARSVWQSQDSAGPKAAITGFRFDEAGNQLCFVTKNHKFSSTIWYYRKEAGQAVKLADDQSYGIAQDLFITDIPVFSTNGRWLFFHLQNRNNQNPGPIPGAAHVDIYSYDDLNLQSQQLKNIDRPLRLFAVIPVTGGPVIQLEQQVDGESRVITPPVNVTGNYVVLAEKLRKNFKPWWLINNLSYTYYLVSLKDGTRKLLKGESKYPIADFSFSPDGNHLVYWNSGQAAYFDYNIQTGAELNATHFLPELSREGDFIDMFENSLCPQPFDQISWIPESQSFLVYGMYDIWKIDAFGRNAPINLTAAYGVKHHISLRLVYQPDHVDNDKVLVTGFNQDTKENGFYMISLAHAQIPRLLTKGRYCYFRTNSQLPSPRLSLSGELPPIQAASTNAWILSRQTANEYPNYFYTRNWINFKVLSDLQPQKQYNWLNSELITWKQLDGTSSQGVLYKPENFNPAKRYPLIFNYYEHLSYRLYEFPAPEYTSNMINIPWFVSRGFLVFTPDIHFMRASAKGGRTFGESVYNSVASAAKYLSTLPYVDGKHMAIQGHSFGGGETNYLVTHCNLFAAACSASGTVSDEISAYLGPYRPKGGFPNSYRLAHAENGHEMIGATLWQRPDLYLRSSSVFNADHVTTALLLMHNEKDTQTDWGQSFELYTALRRLGKPVWLLQYDDEGHSLEKLEDQKDFTIRLTQFFNYYLKDAPPPVWMTRGIPAKFKTIDQGYEFDLSGKHP